MKISAKGRYGLAAMTHLAMSHASGVPVTILSISARLGISKIYLEQVFSLLKRAGLVASIKGAQGGYQLSRAPEAITACDILSAIELSLVETAAPATAGRAPALDSAISASVYNALDDAIKLALSGVTLADILNETERRSAGESMMYFI